MQDLTPGRVPNTDDVRRIAAIANPVIRNLEITNCYSRLAAAFAARSGEGANWCTYATWASRQAGRTIRGEDLLEHLGRKLGRQPLAAASNRDAVASAAAPRPLPARVADRASDGCAAHAVRRVRACQRRRRAREPEGVRGDRARVRRAISTSARRTRQPSPLSSSVSSTVCGPATRPRGSATCARRSRGTSAGGSSAIPKARAQLAVLANLEIGLHEQTRLQPEIREALDAAYATQEDLGRRALEALFPSAARWRPVVRRPAAAVAGVAAAGAQRSASTLAREVITESFMVLSLPGRVLALGTHLTDAYPEALGEPADAELAELLARFEPVAPALDDCGARDWSDLAPADALHRAPVLRLPPERAAHPPALQP